MTNASAGFVSTGRSAKPPRRTRSWVHPTMLPTRIRTTSPLWSLEKRPRTLPRIDDRRRCRLQQRIAGALDLGDVALDADRAGTRLTCRNYRPPAPRAARCLRPAHRSGTRPGAGHQRPQVLKHAKGTVRGRHSAADTPPRPASPAGGGEAKPPAKSRRVAGCTNASGQTPAWGGADTGASGETAGLGLWLRRDGCHRLTGPQWRPEPRSAQYPSPTSRCPALAPTLGQPEPSARASLAFGKGFRLGLRTWQPMR